MVYVQLLPEGPGNLRIGCTLNGEEVQEYVVRVPNVFHLTALWVHQFIYPATYLLLLGGGVVPIVNLHSTAWRPDLYRNATRCWFRQVCAATTAGTLSNLCPLARKPPLYMLPGDEVDVHIAGLGSLRNRIVAEGEEPDKAEAVAYPELPTYTV